MQVALIERDVFVTAPTSLGKSQSISCYHPVQAFLLEPLPREIKLGAPWVLLPCIADVLSIMLLTKVARGNANWTRYYSIL